MVTLSFTTASFGDKTYTSVPFLSSLAVVGFVYGERGRT